MTFSDFPNKDYLIISYSDSVFRRCQIEQQRMFGVHPYFPYTREWLVKTAFYKENRKLLDDKKGGGLWLWKPFIIQHALSFMKEEATLIYVDTRTFVSDYGIGHIRRTVARDTFFLVQNGRAGHLAEFYTRRECFEALGVPESYGKRHQLIAGAVGFANRPAAREFVGEWLGHCRNLRTLVGDVFVQQSPTFIDNRHDQSILTLLAFKHNLPLQYVRKIKPLCLKYHAKALSRFLGRKNEPLPNKRHRLHVVVFSKNRPLQLDALLRSYEANFPYWEKDTTVLYRAGPGFVRGYELLKERFSGKGYGFVEETSFSESFPEDLQKIFRGFDPDSFVMFLVDDILFTAEVPVDRALFDEMHKRHHLLCLALRLGWNTARPGVKLERDGRFLSVRWREADGDFGYPMSLDGNVFRVRDVSPYVTGVMGPGVKKPNVKYWNPNTLEGCMAKRPRSARPIMLCCQKSCLFNLGLNRVQDSIPNPSGNVDPERLLQWYLAGQVLDFKAFAGKAYGSCHVIMNEDELSSLLVRGEA